MFPEQNRPDQNLPAGRVEAVKVVGPQPLKVLVVEDSVLDCELVVQELWNAGFAPEWQRVETEAAFLAGLQAAPDLVVSDFQMPRFNGLRALELLKQSKGDIPFILVSGTIGEDTAVEAMRQGAADYLLKDRLARLGTAVTRALAEARLRRERQRMEQAQVEHAAFTRDVLNSLTSAVVVLDELGNITATNEEWRRFGRENGGGDYAHLNYLNVCSNSVRICGHADAHDAGDGIRRVLAGTAAEFSLEYPCHSPHERR
jgi:CheY-like chemotaxis protein